MDDFEEHEQEHEQEQEHWQEHEQETKRARPPAAHRACADRQLLGYLFFSLLQFVG